MAVAAIVPVDVAVAPGKLKPPNLASRVPPPPAASTPACGLIFARAGNNAASPRVLLEGLVGRTTESQRRLPPPQHAHTPTQTHDTNASSNLLVHTFFPSHPYLPAYRTPPRDNIYYTIPAFPRGRSLSLSLSLSPSPRCTHVEAQAALGRERRSALGSPPEHRQASEPQVPRAAHPRHDGPWHRRGRGRGRGRQRQWGFRRFAAAIGGGSEEEEVGGGGHGGGDGGGRGGGGGTAGAFFGPP